MDRIYFVTLLFLLLAIIFPVPSPPSKQRVIHGKKWGCSAVVPVTHTRGQLSWLPLPRKSPLSEQVRHVQCSSSWAPDQILGQPLTESFFKRLINLLGMSQEDEPFLWRGVTGDCIYGWVCVVAFVCVRVCVCVCTCVPALICMHFTSIKTHSPPEEKKPRSPGCWDHVFLNILGSKQETSEFLKLVWQQAGSGNEPHLSSRRVNSRKKDETKNIISPPNGKYVHSSIPIGCITCSNLLYYYFVCFFNLCPLYFLKDVGMLTAIF